MYRIIEDEQGNFWVGKISKNNVLLRKGTWELLKHVPNKPGHIRHLSEYREGREIIYDMYK